jgi:Trk-type K+ transport system membrane component
VEAFKHTIPRTMQHKAFTIFLFSISIIFFMSFLLTIVHPEIDLLAIVFEEVSAFCTVGLSMGITTHLNSTAKTILIISMFIGRVGILTLAFALGKAKAGDYKYPETHFNVA